MAENSNIEWTDHTFNPWIGCTKLSPACDNCYAEAWDNRFKGGRWGAKSPRTKTSQALWRKPLNWNEFAGDTGTRFRVFCASLADVFDNHSSIDPTWRHDLWRMIKATPNLDWLLLTKRPQNIKKFLPSDWGSAYSNVWLGTTVENQKEAEQRILHLLSVDANVHFLSCEPLLSDLRLYGLPLPGTLRTLDALTGLDNKGFAQFDKGIDWVIAGGESGKDARPMHPDWARNLRDQCDEADVPFLFKQWGEWAPGENAQVFTGSRRCAWWFANSWSMGDIDMSDPEASWMDPPDAYRVGKKVSGRSLDGVVHDGFPEPRRAAA